MGGYEEVADIAGIGRSPANLKLRKGPNFPIADNTGFVAQSRAV
jgi:hypothetical protein